MRDHIKKKVKDILLFLDYVFWMVFDLSKFKLIKKDKIKNALVIHLGAIGELLACTPVLKTLKENINCNVDFLAMQGPSIILRDNPNIRKIINYEENFKKNLENIKNKYDLAIILWPGSLKISTLCLKAGIPYRVGCFKMIKEGPAFFFTRRIFPLKFKNKHAVESNAMFLNLIGLNNKDPKMEVFIDKIKMKRVNLVLKKNGIKDFVIIHPGFGKYGEGKHLSRKWPEERFAKIADYLIEKENLKVIITGIKDEAQLANNIKYLVKNKRNTIVLAGELDLKELICLLSKAKLLLAPDTSIIHIASALNIKTIDLMSRSTPTEWGPWQEKKNFRVLFHPKNSKGDPCGDEDQSCILNITLEEVKKAINELI